MTAALVVMGGNREVMMVGGRVQASVAQNRKKIKVATLVKYDEGVCHLHYAYFSGYCDPSYALVLWRSRLFRESCLRCVDI